MNDPISEEILSETSEVNAPEENIPLTETEESLSEKVESQEVATEAVPTEEIATEELTVDEATRKEASSEKSESNSEIKRPREGRSKERRPKNDRSRNDRNRAKPRPAQERHSINRFVTISWSGQREPVDTMFWCEAERKGSWIEVTALDQVRTRREILERLTELDSGLVGLDFGFSYPQSFMEFLKEKDGVGDWRALIKKVREELKKNVDDGVRLWIECMGKYREAHLEPNPMPIRTYERGRYGREMKERQPTLYEQGSMAERFRRTEAALRRAAEDAMQSTLQVSYNRLTSRYEFSGELQRGRNSLLGMSMLEQLLEAREDVAVWPWQKPAKLTLTEIFPWMFRREKPATPEQCRIILAAEEDSGTEIPSAARDIICRNPEAQRAFFSMMGMIRTEARVEKTIRPLRDYQPQFYSDPRILQEGWFYGVGYKMSDDRKESPRDERQSHQTEEPKLHVEEPVTSEVALPSANASEVLA